MFTKKFPWLIGFFIIGVWITPAIADNDISAPPARLDCPGLPSPDSPFSSLPPAIDLTKYLCPDLTEAEEDREPQQDGKIIFQFAYSNNGQPVGQREEIYDCIDKEWVLIEVSYDHHKTTDFVFNLENVTKNCEASGSFKYSPNDAAGTWDGNATRVESSRWVDPENFTRLTDSTFENIILETISFRNPTILSSQGHQSAQFRTSSVYRSKDELIRTDSNAVIRDNRLGQVTRIATSELYYPLDLAVGPYQRVRSRGQSFDDTKYVIDEDMGYYKDGLPKSLTAARGPSTGLLNFEIRTLQQTIEFHLDWDKLVGAITTFRWFDGDDDIKFPDRLEDLPKLKDFLSHLDEARALGDIVFAEFGFGTSIIPIVAAGFGREGQPDGDIDFTINTADQQPNQIK